VPDLPPRPSLEHLRKQAKTRKRERRIGLSQAQHELAREYGFASWPKLVHHVQASMLDGIERALVLADTKALAVARWSNFTPLDQAAMHGRTDTVRLLIERGADLHDRAFDEDGPTPLDCALWGLKNNRADDGDYPGRVQAMLAAGAPTRQSPPTGDETVDALLASHTARR
jgi:Ankyrin repeats (many copies)